MKRLASLLVVGLAATGLMVFGTAIPAHAAGSGSVSGSDEFSTASCTAVGLGVGEWLLAGTASSGSEVGTADVQCWVHGGPATAGIPTLLGLTKLVASSGYLPVAVTAGLGTGDGTGVCLYATFNYGNFPTGGPSFGTIGPVCSSF